MSGMIGGQQAMFGNFASYAQQISPTGGQGPMPTYQNPMQGAGEAFAPNPLASNMGMQMGPQAISAAGNIGLPAVASGAMLAGSFLPGRAGRVIGGLDPFTQGLRGFGQGMGWMRGAGVGANMSRLASLGGGGMLRAGLGGIGGAAARAVPMLALAQAAQYGVGQMVQGAQFQNQVGGFLQNQFRFVNPESRTGFGFTREQQGQIGGMVREMGHSDMMTGPQELLRVMKGGAQMGLFRAVQDVKEFKKRFTDMVGALKEVATTMNTTMEGAMPFFQQARGMGFWTPMDITRHAQQARATAATTGMSVQQVQQQMSAGTQMARSVGAMGYQGAQGMATSMQVAGGMLRGGLVSEQQMAEAYGTTDMGQAQQMFAQQMQAGATRFARGRRARWVLAALGRNNFQNLDYGRLQDFSSGLVGLGEIGGRARRNIGQQGAYNFVLNERNLRGQLLERGPEAMMGFTRMLAGRHLYGEDPRSRLIMKRLAARSGFRGKQGQMYIQAMRNLPQIMEQNKARTAALADQLERNREQLMDRSFEGVKRKISGWWDREVKEPLQRMGAETSRDMADFWDKMGDKLWGATPTRHRFRGISKTGMHALQRSAMGDTRAMEETFGRAGDFYKEFGAMGGDLGGRGLVEGGPARGFRGQGGLLGGLANVGQLVAGMGSVTNERIELMRRMGVKERSFQTEESRERGMREEGLVAGRVLGGAADYRFKAMGREDVETARQQLYAASTGRISSRSAAALGFGSEKEAKASIESVQKEMSSTSYRLAAARIAEREGLQGRELAERMVVEANRGALGANLQKYVRSGKNMAQRVARLAAAQPAAQRARVGGIDLSEEARTMGMDVFAVGDTERQIGERMEKSEAFMAVTLTAALGGQATEGAASAGRWALPWQTSKRMAGAGVVTPEVIEKVQTKGGEKFKRAMMLMASGTSAEERAENAEKARRMLTDLATDKDRFSPAERQALLAMTDEKSPAAPLVKAAMRDMGKVHKMKSRAEFSATVMRRSQRMMKSMGERGEQILDTLDKIKGGEGQPDLGRIVRSLMDEQDPEQYMAKMRAIVNVSGQADEAQIARAAEMLKGVEGAEHIVSALKSGRQVGQISRALTGKDMGRRTIAANMLMGGIAQLSTKEVKALTTGTAEQKRRLIQRKVESLEKSGQKDKADMARDMLTAIGSGEPTKLMEKARQKALAQSVSVLGDPKKSILHTQIRQMRAGEVQGQLGSPQGMHTEMVKQTILMQRIAEAAEKEAGANPTGNPSEKPVTGGSTK
jgi:hypothetical protein